MKSINEAAKELSRKNYHHEHTIKTDIKHACQEMAVFMQQWILVKDELPSTSNNYLNRDVVLNLLLGKFKYQQIGFYTDGSKSFENEDGKIEFLKDGWYCEELQCDSGDVAFVEFSSNVVSWRPIEFK